MKQYYVGSDRVNLLKKIDRPSMVSAYAVRDRKSDISINANQNWMMDSGAFTQVTNFGDFVICPEKYIRIAMRFEHSGRLDCIATQDYMCEPDVINKLREKGREASVRIHQRKTIDRFIRLKKEARKQGLGVPVMPVLQGWEVEDYVEHFKMYQDLINLPTHYYLPGPYGEYFPVKRNWNQWLGIGSTCKRNKNPEIVSNIIDALEEYWDEQCIKKDGFRIHLFGFKKTGLRLASIRDRIYSADSFAYDYANRMKGGDRRSETRATEATDFHDEIVNQPVQACLQLI